MNSSSHSHSPYCPPLVGEILHSLEAAGYEAYLVGGCVRDLVLGREPHDWDICTSALPEEVEALFEVSSVGSGRQHGTLVVAGHEVTTFRGDGVYSDGRRPDSVRLGVSLEEDLARRDFTMNAMAMDVRGRVVDPFGGREDLEAGLIRCVGEPAMRFAEDGLRILRAARFAAVLGFEVEAGTLEGMRGGVAAGVLSGVSQERVRDELVKMLAPGSDARMGLEALRHCSALAAVLPEVARCVGVRQNRWHQEEVYEHLLLVCEALSSAPWQLRLAALLHDIGKPICAAPSLREPGALTFPGHEGVGAELAEGVTRRLRLSRVDRERIVRLVRGHGFCVDDGVSDAGVRRWMRKVGESAGELIALRAADLSGRRSDVQREGIVEAYAARVAAERERMAGCASALAIGGREVMEVLGLTSGPEVGRVLRKLTEAVLELPELNTRAGLLALLKKGLT